MGGHPDTGVTPGGDNGAGAKSSGAADIQGMPWAPELGRALEGFPSRFWKEHVHSRHFDLGHLALRTMR